MFKLIQALRTKINSIRHWVQDKKEQVALRHPFLTRKLRVLKNGLKAAVCAVGGLFLWGISAMLYLHGTIFHGAAFWTCFFKSVSLGVSMKTGIFICMIVPVVATLIGVLLTDDSENEPQVA